MGAFDDAMKNATPGGNLATPIAVALGALILGKMFGGGSTPAPRAREPVPRQPVPAPTGAPADSILGGLNDLIGKLTAGGAAPQVNSWMGPGQNQPIQPGQLGGALGQNVLDELSQRTGMDQRELLNQLAVALPQLVNHLTPNGRIPTRADFEKREYANLLVGTEQMRGVFSRHDNSNVGRAQIGPTSSTKHKSSASDARASNAATASQLLNLILKTSAASVFVAELVQKVINENNKGVTICLAAALALSRVKGESEAHIFCRNLHRALLKNGRDRDVPKVMLFQAKLYHRKGESMARDLYAVEAGSGFADFHDLKGVSAALELINT